MSIRPWEVVERLAATTKKLEKEQIVLDAYLDGCFEFFEGAKLAYDKLITFMVAKVPEGVNNSYASDLDLDDWMDLTDALSQRKLTGHAARDAIQEMCDQTWQNQWNSWYRRILLKDLSCGITEGTINRVLDKLTKGGDPAAVNYRVPVFAIQRAHDGAKGNNAKRIKGLMYADAKLDGARLATVLELNSTNVTQYTRSGKINTNFPEITSALAKITPFLSNDIVLDGEIMSDNFNSLMTMLNRKSFVDTSGAVLFVFDLIGLEEFRAGYDPTPQSDRHAALLALQPLLDEHCQGKVVIIQKRLLDLDIQEGRDQLAAMKAEAGEVIDEVSGCTRWEGIVVKDPMAPYEGKRVHHWLKVKPWIEVDLPVINMIEGEDKYEGMLGALVCHGVDDDVEIHVKVGSGITDQQRQEWWNNPDLVIGQVIAIRADAVTDNEDGTHSLRFPRFIRFRSLDGTPGEKD